MKLFRMLKRFRGLPPPLARARKRAKPDAGLQAGPGAALAGETGRLADMLAVLSDRYVTSVPSLQNMVDVVPGWNHAFPVQYGVTAGAARLYDDPRITWCIEQAGSLAGKTVLELGPLEGMHTSMLALSGAAQVDAVEANALAFLRCLITREILRFGNACFRLGDFVEWLKQVDTRYDLVVACGVLYHSPDPLGLLELIAQRTDQFYLWTHYVDEALLADGVLHGAFSGKVLEREFRGATIGLHERSYHQRWSDPAFCGGFRDVHFWFDRGGLLEAIDRLGFDAVVNHDAPEHPNGPSLSIFARRREGAPPS